MEKRRFGKENVRKMMTNMANILIGTPGHVRMMEILGGYGDNSFQKAIRHMIHVKNDKKLDQMKRSLIE